MLISATLLGRTPGVCGLFAEQLDQAGADMLVLDGQAHSLDPLILGGWLASRVRRAGLVAMVPALYTAPFHAARALSALDFMTLGRSGWWPTTLGHVAQAPSVSPQALTPPDEVSPKAMDFIAATNSLWDSWDADALIIDKASGVYLDAARVRRVHYQGPYFQVMGPLAAARPPQGYPVVVQSDADPLWRDAAALTDVLVVSSPSTPLLATRRAEVEQEGRSTRLLAEVSIDETEPLSTGLGDLLAWFEAGAIDGVHLVPTGAGAMGRVLELMASLAGAGGDRRNVTSLHARLGLTAPAAILLKKARV